MTAETCGCGQRERAWVHHYATEGHHAFQPAGAGGYNAKEELDYLDGKTPPGAGERYWYKREIGGEVVEEWHPPDAKREERCKEPECSMDLGHAGPHWTVEQKLWMALAQPALPTLHHHLCPNCRTNYDCRRIGCGDEREVLCGHETTQGLKRESALPPGADAETQEAGEGGTGSSKEERQTAALRKLQRKYDTVKGDLRTQYLRGLRACYDIALTAPDAKAIAREIHALIRRAEKEGE